MRVHGAVGEDELHVRAARAAPLPGLELERGEIGDEVGLPHVPAGPHRDEVALAAEVPGGAFALREPERVGEDEVGVVKQVHHHRQVVRRREPDRFKAAAVEVLVARVQRQREQALRPPLEGMGGALVGLDRGSAVARQHVHHLLEEVLLGLGLAARRDVQHEHRDEVAAPLEVDDGAARAEPRPRRGLDCQKVDAEILDHGNALAGHPVAVRIEQVFRVVRVRHWLTPPSCPGAGHAARARSSASPASAMPLR